MREVQEAIFPAVVVAGIVIYFLTTLLAGPVPVQASSDAEVSVTPTAIGQGTNDCNISTRFPQSIRQWCSLIEKFAAESSLEPNLVAAVMLQESGGNPRAYSHSGAVGLLQVMPRDGLAAGFMCVNGPCFSNRPSMAELFNPEFNIAYGARMLAGLVRKTGSIREALRAYGPNDMGYRYADIILGIYNSHR